MVFAISSLIFTGSAELALLIASKITRYASYDKAETAAGSLLYSFLYSSRKTFDSLVIGVSLAKK